MKTTKNTPASNAPEAPASVPASAPAEAVPAAVTPEADPVGQVIQSILTNPAVLAAVTNPATLTIIADVVKAFAPGHSNTGGAEAATPPVPSTPPAVQAPGNSQPDIAKLLGAVSGLLQKNPSASAPAPLVHAGNPTDVFNAFYQELVEEHIKDITERAEERMKGSSLTGKEFADKRDEYMRAELLDLYGYAARRFLTPKFLSWENAGNITGKVLINMFSIAAFIGCGALYRKVVGSDDESRMAA